MPDEPETIQTADAEEARIRNETVAAIKLNSPIRQTGPAMSPATMDRLKADGVKTKLERARKQLQDLKDAVAKDGHQRVNNRAAMEKRVEDLEKQLTELTNE